MYETGKRSTCSNLSMDLKINRSKNEIMPWGVAIIYILIFIGIYFLDPYRGGPYNFIFYTGFIASFINIIILLSMGRKLEQQKNIIIYNVNPPNLYH